MRKQTMRWGAFCAPLLTIWVGLNLPAAEIFHVATYNLDNYLEQSTGTRSAKSLAAKSVIVQNLRLMHAEVVALQEVGGTDALLELKASLKSAGLDYPYSEIVGGVDTNIQVAVLSQFPLISRHPHTNESFLLFGRRHFVSRGFLEVDVEVIPTYRFTLLAVHLKSRRPTPEADEADLREQEALLLRGIIDERLRTSPQLNLVVLGDFNDTKNSKTLRCITGRGRMALLDTRPAERDGKTSTEGPKAIPLRNVTWTYYFDREDTYSRIDYILISRGMALEWEEADTFIPTLADWGLASDHRPIVAGFRAENGKAK